MLKVESLLPGSDTESQWEHLSGWLDRLPGKNFRHYATGQQESMRVATLFITYHRFLTPLDAWILKQVENQSASGTVPFGKECVEELAICGFEKSEAARYLAIFYQLRRAHHFIAQGLRGSSASMAELRRRLWSSVFTSDVRWYDKHLWNRMEDFSTLLLGETGTGKGTTAAAIGRSGFIPYDPGRNQFVESFNRAFVPLNLAQFPESLLEAELFGYRKGAFTGAVQAHDGVFARCSPHGAIFLDEIGEVSPPVQVKLLQVLQERVFSPVGSRDKLMFRGRVISATNQPIDRLRREKRFRDDLYYRISSDVITVPPLRQRLQESSDEMTILLESIVSRMTAADPALLIEGVLEKLRHYPGPGYGWPGNVRELEQATRRILLTGEYRGELQPGLEKNAGLAEEIRGVTLSVDQLLGKYCEIALERFGTRAEVARRLGLDVRTVQKYLDSIVDKPADVNQ